MIRPRTFSVYPAALGLRDWRILPDCELVDGYSVTCLGCLAEVGPLLEGPWPGTTWELRVLHLRPERYVVTRDVGGPYVERRVVTVYHGRCDRCGSALVAHAREEEVDHLEWCGSREVGAWLPAAYHT